MDSIYLRVIRSTLFNRWKTLVRTDHGDFKACLAGLQFSLVIQTVVFSMSIEKGTPLQKGWKISRFSLSLLQEFLLVLLLAAIGDFYQITSNSHFIPCFLHNIFTHFHLPIAKQPVQLDNQVFFVLRILSSLDTWLEVIQPPQPATFPASI